MEIYRTGTKFLDAADNTHQKYQQETAVAEADYSDGIPIARAMKTGEVIRIAADATTRIGLFGPSGAGKTTLAKAFLSRASHDGYNVIHGSDVKNDFQSFDYDGGASNKLRNKTQGLLPGEDPAAQDRILAIPNFLANEYSSDPSSYGTRFSVTLSDLTETEFRHLIGYHDWRSGAAKETMDEILMQVDLQQTSLGRYDPQTGQGTGLIYEAAKRNQSTLVRKLRSVKSDRLLDERCDKNIRDVLSQLSEKNVFSLGLKEWRKYVPGDEHFFQFYSAKVLRVLREIIDADDLSPPFIIFEDEFHSLAPQGEESLVKDEFQEWYDRAARQRDVTTMISAQRSSQLPNPANDDDLDFISDLTDAFIMRGRPTPSDEDWKPIVDAMGVYDRVGGTELTQWKRKINALDRFQGVYINSERHSGPGDCPIIESLAPLVSHPG